MADEICNVNNDGTQNKFGIEAAAADLDPKSHLEKARTNRFKDVFGDWERYQKAIVDNDKKTLSEMSYIKPRVHSDGSPKLEEFNKFVDLQGADFTEALIVQKQQQYKFRTGEFSGVTKLTLESIAEGADPELLRFDDESYLNNRLREMMVEEEIPKTGRTEVQDKIVAKMREDILKDLDKWKDLADLGSQLHSINKAIIDDETIVDYATAKGKISKPGGMLESNFEAYINEVTSKVTSLRTRGKLIAEHTVYYDGDIFKVKSDADIILIKDDGNIEIYDYKYSLKDFKEWNDQKDKTVQYQLGLTRNILRNYGIQVDAIKIIPATIDYARGTANVLDINFGVEEDFGFKRDIREGTKVQEVINSFIPNNFFSSNKSTKGATAIANILNDRFNIQLPSSDNITFSHIKDKYIIPPREGFRGKLKRPGVSGYLIDNITLEQYNDEAKLKALIEPHMVAFKDYERSGVNKMKVFYHSLKESIETGKDEPTFDGRDERTKYFKTLFDPYVREGWSLQERGVEEAEELGFLVMTKNTSRGDAIVNLIAYTEHDLESKHPIIKKSELLTGVYKRDHTVRQHYYKTNTPEARAKNIAGLKAALWAIYNHDTFTKGNIKLKKIIVASKNEHAKPINFDHMKEMIEFMDIKDSNIQEGVKKNYDFVQNSILVDYLHDLSKDALKPRARFFTKKYEDFIANLEDFEAKKINQKELVEYLEREQRRLLDLQRSGSAHYDETYDKLLSGLIREYKGIFAKAENDIPEIGALVGENKWLSTTSELNSSEIMGHIKRNLSNAFLNIQTSFIRYKDRFTPKLEAYYKSVGYKGVKRYIIGNVTAYSRDLIEYYEDNDSNNDVVMRLRKPRPDDSKETKNLLNFILEEMNKERMSRLKTAEEKEAFKQSDAYRNLPLIRASLAAKLNGINKKVDYKTALNLMNENLLDFEKYTGNPKDYVKENESQLLIFDHIGKFDRDLEARKEFLNETANPDVEINLEAILDFYVKDKLNQKHLNPVLQENHSLKAALKYESTIPGTISGIPKYLLEKIGGLERAGIKNVPEVHHESPFLHKLIFGTTRVTSLFSIGFSPFTGMMQLLQGMWGAVSAVTANKYGREGRFGLKDFGKAFRTVMVKGVTDRKTQELLRKMDHYYRISTDTHFLAQKTQERSGVFGLKTKWAYWFNNVTESANRLLLFTAQMYKDGSFDAHSVVNGKLVYNPRKDKRFEAYFKGDKSDPKYASQKSLYDFIKKEQERENQVDYYTSEEGVIQKAYTNREVHDLKTYSDDILGAYDHEHKSEFSRWIFGRAIMQFKEGWIRPRINRYYRDSSVSKDRGQWVEKTTDDGQIVYDWEGEKMEGIFQTLMFLVNEVRGDDGIVAHIKRAIALGKNFSQLERTKKQNFIKLINDVAIIALGAMVFQLPEDEDEHGPLAHLVRMLSRSTEDMSIIANVTTFNSPLPAISYLERTTDTLMSVLTGEENPTKVLTAFGAVRPIHNMLSMDE